MISRATLRFTSILGATAAVAMLTACSPTQPPPMAGGAKLTPDVVNYDRPEFLTNRPSAMVPGKECEKVTQHVLDTIGIPHIKSKTQQDPDKGCDVQIADAGFYFASAPATAPFQRYWFGGVTDTDLPGSSAGFGQGTQPTSFQRKILDGKYHSVTYTTDANTVNAVCWTAVDTGSPHVFLVGAYPLSEDPLEALRNPVPLQTLQQTHCPVSEKIARTTLRIVDPEGGSRTP